MATTVENFKCLGAANGLVGCIRKSDDPSFDPQDASPLTFSLEQVMDFFWLMEGASAMSGGSWTVNTSSEERENHPNLPASWTVSVDLDFAIGFGGGIQIIEDANSTSKNRYGIMSNLFSTQVSHGYFFSTFDNILDYHMTTYDPRSINPSAIEEFDGTISIGDFTLYAWYTHIIGGGGFLGDATIPLKANQPRISAFEKYIIEE